MKTRKWYSTAIKPDMLQELHCKLDSLSKEDFEKVWAKYYQKEEPVSEDLETEIKRIRQHHFINDDFDKTELDGRTISNIARHFANWQKQKDAEVLLNHAKCIDESYKKGIKIGKAEMKQQMIKEAITGQLENGEDYLRIKCLYTSCRPQDDGKLVKFIIINED